MDDRPEMAHAMEGRTPFVDRDLINFALKLPKRLLFNEDRGKLLLVQATPDGYVEKGNTQALDGLCWTAPAAAGGRLYLRNHTEMVVYDLEG